MTSDARLLIYALGAVVVLIVLIARLKMHPLIALTTVSLAMGIVAGMPLGGAVKAFQDGVGTALGFIAIVVGIGTMLGKMMAESGAATRIATTLIARFGERRVHWALMIVAFILGIPVFFQVGFVLLIPLVFTIGRQTGLSLIKIGIPLVAGLSVVHGMLPPHPAAMLAVGAFNADVGRTILYGLIVGLPTAALAGPIFGAWIARRIALPPDNPMALQLSERDTAASMPGFAISLFTILVPVLLMLLATAGDSWLAPESVTRVVLHFVGNPIVSLLLALLFSFWSLTRARRFSREQLLKYCNECLGPTATILLVIGAGAGFNQVLISSGVGRAVAELARVSHASPIILAWTIATLIRVATGSATVAMTTAAGIVAPIAASSNVHAELLVLATGAGSLMLSHVNDAGFWLIKEFFDMTVPQTLKTWTVAETIIGVAGLAFTLLLSLVV
ncbi:MAG TPA: GntP family permease [Gemmatimonadaceae bacterium]|nr:GntP family permease [Gemmatimonadaceae bacterium]